MGFEDQTTSEATDPRRGRVHDSNYVLNELKDILLDSRDAFGDQVRRGTSNRLDLPAFNPFSEERYRYIENGNRVQDPDTDSTRFTNTDKTFRIKPDAGDTIEFKTAEAPRYVPGFDAAVSWSYNFDTFLHDAGDEFTLFVEDCYELRLFGDGTVKAVTIEDGTDNVVESATLPTAETNPLRPELVFNWYDVGRAEWNADYTDDGENRQLSETLATLTDETDWLSDSPVGRVGFRLDVANGGIALDAGSVGYTLQADVVPTGRPKPFILTSSELDDVAATGYTVLGALRIDPDRDQVFTTMTNLETEVGADVDAEIWLKAVPDTQTDADFIDVRGDGSDAGPAHPRQMSPDNSVLQWTPTVSTFPTRTDAVTGNDIPSGRLVGLAFRRSSGVGASVESSGLGFRRPRPVYPDDVVLIIGHTPNGQNSTAIELFGSTEQDW